MLGNKSWELFIDTLATDQKFEYFFAGFIGASCGYIWKSMGHVSIGLNEPSIQIVALLFLAGSLYLCFDRVDTGMLIRKLNVAKLDLMGFRNKKVDSVNELMRRPDFQDGFIQERYNRLLGEIVEAERRIESLAGRIEVEDKPQELWWKVRTWFVILGFFFLMLSKLV